MTVRVTVHAPTDRSGRLYVRYGWVSHHPTDTFLVHVVIVLARIAPQRAARVVVALAAHPDRKRTLAIDCRYAEQQQGEGESAQNCQYAIPAVSRRGISTAKRTPCGHRLFEQHNLAHNIDETVCNAFF